MQTNHQHPQSPLRDATAELSTPKAVNPSDLSWSGLWARLSRHSDGSPRVSLERGEQMIMELRSCDQGGVGQERAEILRDTLARFCDDLSLFDSVRRMPELLRNEEQMLLDAWLHFRCSAQSWSDLSAVLRRAEQSPLLARLVAQEICSDQRRYLADLTGAEDFRTMQSARRVARFLSVTSPLLPGETAPVLLEVGEALRRKPGAEAAEYVSCIEAYVKSPSASAEEGLAAALRAANTLSQRLDVSVQQQLLRLGELLGYGIPNLPTNALGPLIRLPDATLVGIAPAIVARLRDDLGNPDSYTTLSSLATQLPHSLAKLDPCLQAKVVEPISNQVLACLPHLNPVMDSLLLRQLVPWAIRGDWFRREAQILWDILSSCSNPSYYPVQVQLVRNILESSDATDAFCNWCHSHASYPWFAERFKSVGGLVSDFLKARKDFGESSVSESECLRALSVVSSLGISAKGLIPEVAGLLGISVIELPFFGPKVLPLSSKVDSSPEVIKACRHLLKALGTLCRPEFVAALKRRGL